jgi:membrane protein DedA with SNARE-associated domain
LAEFWAEWGMLAYLAAAIWAFFEGETFVLVASALGAATGVVDPWILMFAVWFGSFLGDQTWFTLGRRYGPAALQRFRSAERHAATARSMLERHGTLFVLSFRFIYGVRNVAAAVCGLSGMDRRRFMVLNFIAAGVWAASFVAAGWFLGAWIGTENLGWAIGVAGLSVLAFLLIRLVRRRRQRLAVASGGAAG